MTFRSASLVVGVLALAVVWSDAVRELSARSFAVHMTVHMTVVAIAAPLIAAALAGSAADPSRRVPWLFLAIPASLVELIVVWTWHAPVLHHAARHSAPLFIVEQGSFLVAGLMLWLSVLGHSVASRRDSAGTGIVALLLTFAHMTLLGALLALTPRPLYHASGDPGMMTPLADQQLGGTIMLVVSALSYIGGGLWLGRRLLQSPRPAGTS